MSRNIRTSQLLTTFGIGQIVSFPNDESLMICGLDKWDDLIESKRAIDPDSIDDLEMIIQEPRLEGLLGVQRFKKPAPFKIRGTNNELTIPAVRFPSWHYCLTCFSMRQVNLKQQDSPVCKQQHKNKDCNGRMIPVRFVAACAQGHIQDVPFMEWVHYGALPSENAHLLKYESGIGAGDLSSIIISCSCGARRSLTGIMNEGSLTNMSKKQNDGEESTNESGRGELCRGYRPWLGSEGLSPNAPCGLELRVLIRGGSNVHYGKLVSALYLPKVDEDVNPLVAKIYDRIGEDKWFKYYRQDTAHLALRTAVEMQPEIENAAIDAELCFEAIKTIIEAKLMQAQTPARPADEISLRLEEYNYLLRGRSSENSDLVAQKKNLASYDNAAFLQKYFSSVVLVSKLRETKVFTGFTRINSEDGRSRQEQIQSLSLSPKNWLPAYVVYGEGIFLQFHDDLIDKFRKEAAPWTELLVSRYHAAALTRNPAYQPRDIDAGFILIHTFSHLIIKRLCFNCGYGSSSLKERIFYGTKKDGRMNGVLIYTSSGDSEGSMGGLVRQGTENLLANLVKDAIADAAWCSADPVCSDIGTKVGQGPDNVNGSACHSCCIVPETSCEEFNCILDRTTIVGSLSDPNKSGYFQE